MPTPPPKTDLSSTHSLQILRERDAPYWNILEFCRHIGFLKKKGRDRFWLARVRTRSGGYLQRRLGHAQPFQSDGLAYAEAVKAACDWFASPDVLSIASDPYPTGVNQQLRYEKSVDGFTVGDALGAYVEWKRIAAARTHFETNLSLINHHIVPRLGHVLLSDFNGHLFNQFCIDVLETPPKRGNQTPRPRLLLKDIEQDALAKRKKTLNTLIGVLRQSFRMAWENSDIESDRAWRCLKRLPHADTARQHFLTRTQCKALVAASRPDLRKLVLGALYTGCRVSELAKLRVRDVGGTFFGLYIAPLKSYRARYVHLPDEGMSFFLDQVEGKGEEDLVFTMENGNRWAGGHKHLFRNVVSAAGLPAGFVFHGLRHTYASQLVQAGTPLAIIAKQLGHATTDTVSRTYGHRSCQSVEEELSRRFAPLAKPRTDGRLSGIRTSLQSHPHPETSWPLRNMSEAQGELVVFLRHRHYRDSELKS